MRTEKTHAPSRKVRKVLKDFFAIFAIFADKNSQADFVRDPVSFFAASQNQSGAGIQIRPEKSLFPGQLLIDVRMSIRRYSFVPMRNLSMSATSTPPRPSN